MDRIFRHLGPVLAQVNKNTLHSPAYFGAALHQLEKIFGAQKLKNSPWGDNSETKIWYLI